MSDRAQRWVIILLLLGIIAGGVWKYQEDQRQEGVDRYKELLEDRTNF